MSKVVIGSSLVLMTALTGVNVYFAASGDDTEVKTIVVKTPVYKLPSSTELKRFEDFEQKFGRKNTGDARMESFENFMDAVKRVDAHNAKPNKTFTMGINEFTDMSRKEFRANKLGYKAELKKQAVAESTIPRKVFSSTGIALPKSIDWRDEGAVTGVKNQGQCGSCWSFSTTGAIEGAWQQATGKLVSVSEQEMVDCDQTDSGCNGGLMDYAFEFVQKNGLESEADYGYTAREGSCKEGQASNAIPKGAITAINDVDSSDAQAMKEALQKGPVSIAIEADQYSFQGYSGGVMSDYCGTNLDHGVLCVGYNDDAETPYWIVKNSWGADWGENGYIRLSQESDNGADGQCGMLKQPSYPSMSQSAAPKNIFKLKL